MVNNSKILKWSVKTGVAMAALFTVFQCVYAISGAGYLSGGEDKSKKGTGSFSDIKSTVTFSIKDKYGISSKEAFTRSHNRALTPAVEGNTNALVTYKKGNVVYIMPYKTPKGMKMQGAITLSPSQSSPLSR